MDLFYPIPDHSRFGLFRIRNTPNYKISIPINSNLGMPKSPHALLSLKSQTPYILSLVELYTVHYCRVYAYCSLGPLLTWADLQKSNEKRVERLKKNLHTV